MNTYILPTSNAEYLCKDFKELNEIRVIYPSKNKDGSTYYPDGEVYMRIPNIDDLAGQRAVVLHSGFPRPNDGLIELELMLQILKETNLGKIDLFIEDFPYPGSAESFIRKFTQYYGVEGVYVANAPFFGEEWVKNYHIIESSEVPLEHISEQRSVERVSKRPCLDVIPKETVIIPTSTVTHLCSDLGDGLVIPSEVFFSKDNISVEIPYIDNLREKRVVVLHSGSHQPNDGLIELDMILDKLNNLNINAIDLFFTFYAYCRADQIWKKGETNVAQNFINKYIEYYGVRKIFSIDSHFAGQEWVKKYPITEISAVSLLKEKARQDYGDILFLAPDSGSKRRTGLDGANKTRENSYEVIIETPEQFESTVKGRVIGVVDDGLYTGGTLITFFEECMKNDAEAVVALITHGVLDKGIKRVLSKYSKLYLTNTINKPQANVDIRPLIIEAIKE